ncbi:Cation/H+ exchanger, partial [Pelagophyceae sp. CCMP2097]
ESHDDDDDDDDHDNGRPYEAVIFIGVALFMGTVTLWALDRFELSAPYTMVIFVEGMIYAGVDHASDESLGVLSRSIRLWEHIDPELLLISFLPILIFGDALQLNAHLFWAKLPQCLMLAGPGVLMSAFAIGVFVWACTPYDWPFFFACTFGAISSATDPVAVVALLQTLGASPAMTMVITGEALLNDGTAVVLFWLFLSLAQGNEKYKSATSIAAFFARMTLGGPLIGAGFGLAAVVLLRVTSRKFVQVDTTLQLSVTVATAYTSYYVAD